MGAISTNCHAGSSDPQVASLPKRDDSVSASSRTRKKSPWVIEKGFGSKIRKDGYRWCILDDSLRIFLDWSHFFNLLLPFNTSFFDWQTVTVLLRPWIVWPATYWVQPEILQPSEICVANWTANKLHLNSPCFQDNKIKIAWSILATSRWVTTTMHFQVGELFKQESVNYHM